MSDESWYFRLNPVLFLFLVWICLTLMGALGYQLGKKAKSLREFKLSDLIPSSIMGLLALILGFSFSMAVTRFEKRRELAVQEANAISTAYFRVQALKEIQGINVKDLYKTYVDRRIATYESNNWDQSIQDTFQLEKKIKDHFLEVSKNERGALESAYVMSMTEMFDAANERNFALVKPLPTAIYLVIFIFACISVCVLNFDRGYTQNIPQWRSGIIVVLFTIIFYLVYDLDHPRKGIIQISQDAMIQLRQSM